MGRQRCWQHIVHAGQVRCRMSCRKEAMIEQIGSGMRHLRGQSVPAVLLLGRNHLLTSS